MSSLLRLARQLLKIFRKMVTSATSSDLLKQILFIKIHFLVPAAARSRISCLSCVPEARRESKKR